MAGVIVITGATTAGVIIVTGGITAGVTTAGIIVATGLAINRRIVRRAGATQRRPFAFARG